MIYTYLDYYTLVSSNGMLIGSIKYELFYIDSAAVKADIFQMSPYRQAQSIGRKT